MKEKWKKYLGIVLAALALVVGFLLGRKKLGGKEEGKTEKQLEGEKSLVDVKVENEQLKAEIERKDLAIKLEEKTDENAKNAETRAAELVASPGALPGALLDALQGADDALGDKPKG
jgi:hypothetical protein